MIGSYSIQTVQTTTHKADFHSLPKTIYADYPAWIEAPHADVECLFTEKAEGSICRWVVYKNGLPAGRIVAFTSSKLRVGVKDEVNGGIGFFECIDDGHVARLLFQTVEIWFKQFNVQKIYGPIHPAEKDSYWGLLVDGFDKAPGFRKNFHPRYYGKLFSNNGYSEMYQQYSYSRPLLHDMNDFMNGRVTEIAKTTQYTFSSIKNIPEKEYQEHILNIYNQSWGQIPGFKILTPEQNRSNFKKIKTILNKDYVWIAFHQQKAVGFAIFLPEIADHIKDFKGKWSLYHQLKLLLRLKLKPSHKVIGLGFGVVPEHQGLGLSQLLVSTVGRHIRSQKVKEIELNWIGDFNQKMMSLVESFGCIKSKTHITFSKSLSAGVI